MIIITNLRQCLFFTYISERKGAGINFANFTAMSMFCVLLPGTGNLASGIGAEVRIAFDLDGVAGHGMMLLDGLRLRLVE